MGGWMYGFEAKEIQSFVFRSTRLKDMAGGSELVNRLYTSFLDAALAEIADGSHYKVLSRGAGAARVEFAERAVADTFATAWPMLVDQFVPGVRVVQGLVEIAGGASDTVDHLRERLRTARNRPVPQLPEIGPLIDRSPLTGAAAVAWNHSFDGTPELVDRDIDRRRTYANTRASLLAKLAGGDQADEELWPTLLDEIAETEGENAYLAVVHADGNDLGATIGQLLRSAASSGDSAVELFTRFSEAVEATTQLAAQEAFRLVLQADFENRSRRGNGSPTPKYAARPIVLGGDDLTIVMRADLAFGFLEAFLGAFERISAVELDAQGLKGRAAMPNCLTACGGIAFVKKSYPFHRAYGLCESLCAFSKKDAKAVRDADGIVPSCFAFHRVTASLSESFDEIREKELTGADAVALYAGPYAVGAHGGKQRRLRDLLGAAALIGRDKVPAGSVRKLVSELYRSGSAAKRGYARIRQVNGNSGTEFQNALEALGGDPDCPIFTPGGKTSLLPDVHAARSIIKDAEVGDDD